MRAAIEIVEVSPRDGLQNEAVVLPTEIKVELILRALSAGVRRLEAVSFVNPKAVPQMADAEAVMTALKASKRADVESATLIGLVLNRRGVDRAIASGVDQMNFVVVATETFNRRNQGVSMDQTLRELADSAAVAAQHAVPLGVTIGAAFGCPFEGETPIEQVSRLAGAAAEAGAFEVALADTIGVADPLSVEARLDAARAAAPGIPLRCHFHNTRNTGIANAFAAWRWGVDTLDTSIGGIGGCPFAPAATGNIPTEDVVYMLDRMGVASGLHLESLIETARWLGEQLGKTTPGMLARAGLFPTPLYTKQS